MVVTKKKSSIIKTKSLNTPNKRADSMNDSKLIKRKLSTKRTSIINNKKVLREKKTDNDYNRGWSWAHAIMLITISLCTYNGLNLYNINYMSFDFLLIIINYYCFYKKFYSKVFSIILYDSFISEFFSHSVTIREKRDLINKRIKNIRAKRAPIGNLKIK